MFMNLVMSGNPMAGMQAGAGGAGMGAMGGMGGGARPQGQPRPNVPGAIQVSAQELEAIQRLQSFGFSQVRAAEAYFAFDKNEDAAANYLFETAVEDDNAQMQAATQ